MVFTEASEEYGHMKATNIVLNTVKVTELLLFYSTLQGGEMVSNPKYWTCTHLHITKNQFIEALVPQRQGLK